MPRWNKSELKLELLQLLDAQLEAARSAQRETAAGATHPEAKSEGDKDTRATEQSYLARGQAKRVEKLQRSTSAIRGFSIRAFSDSDVVALSAIVSVEESDETKSLLIAPDGGGSVLAKGAISVVTPRSPLGSALMRKSVGDFFELVVGGRTRELTVVGIE